MPNQETNQNEIKLTGLLQALQNSRNTPKTQEQILEQLKVHMAHLVDNLESTPSYLTRVARLWGKVALWQK